MWGDQSAFVHDGRVTVSKNADRAACGDPLRRRRDGAYSSP